MKTRWITVMILGLAGGIAPAPPDTSHRLRHEKEESWLVFSSRSPLPMKHLRNWPLPDRLVLAVENHSSGRLPQRFLEDVRDLKEWMGQRFDLPVCDLAALRILHQLKVRRLPAWIRFAKDEIIIIEGLPPIPPEILQ